MKQGLFESDSAYKERVQREAAAKLGVEQGFFESDESYSHRVTAAVGEQVGAKQGLFESDSSYERRVGTEIGRSVGVTQGIFESDASFQKRTEAAIGSKMGLKQGLFESDSAFSERVRNTAAQTIAETGPGDSVDGFFGAIRIILIPVVIVALIISYFTYKSRSGGYDKHNYPAVSAVSSQKIRVGDILTFGRYEQDLDSSGDEDIEWIVLDKENGRLLMISRYVLDCQQYNDYNEKTDWASCSLRRWLNSSFYDKAFNYSEKAMVQTVTLEQDSNAGRVCASTRDRVFLLSVDEANRFFSSESKRICLPTGYAKQMGVRAKMKLYTRCNWWLRSPGGNDNAATIVYHDGEIESGYAATARATNQDVGVRPAIWIVLDTGNTYAGSAGSSSGVQAADIWDSASLSEEDPTWYEPAVIRSADVATLAEGRLGVTSDGSASSVKWSSGPVRDVFSNEYPGYISFYVAETRQPCPDITLDPGGNERILDAWVFVSGTGAGVYTVEGGETDSEETLGLRFYADGRQIWDTGLLRSIDGAQEIHLDLSGAGSLRIELYAGEKSWGSRTRVYLSGGVRDKGQPSVLPTVKPPQRPDPVLLTELGDREVASNWQAPEGNYSDYSTKPVTDPRGSTYQGCLVFAMSKHNESAPWTLLDLGGEYNLLDMTCFVMDRFGESQGPTDSLGLLVYADDRLICDTGLINGDMSPRQLHLNVSGAKTLKIQAYVGADCSSYSRIYVVNGSVSK